MPDVFLIEVNINFRSGHSFLLEKPCIPLISLVVLCKLITIEQRERGLSLRNNHSFRPFISFFYKRRHCFGNQSPCFLTLCFLSAGSYSIGKFASQCTCMVLWACSKVSSLARLESLPCVENFSPTHIICQPWNSCKMIILATQNSSHKTILYVTLYSQHICISLKHANYLSKLLAAMQVLDYETFSPCILQSFQSEM